jgi:hypothetical protein
VTALAQPQRSRYLLMDCEVRSKPIVERFFVIPVRIQHIKRVLEAQKARKLLVLNLVSLQPIVQILNIHVPKRVRRHLNALIEKCIAESLVLGSIYEQELA